MPLTSLLQESQFLVSAPLLGKLVDVAGDDDVGQRQSGVDRQDPLPIPFPAFLLPGHDSSQFEVPRRKAARERPLGIEVFRLPPVVGDELVGAVKGLTVPRAADLESKPEAALAEPFVPDQRFGQPLCGCNDYVRTPSPRIPHPRKR